MQRSGRKVPFSSSGHAPAVVQRSSHPVQIGAGEADALLESTSKQAPSTGVAQWLFGILVFGMLIAITAMVGVGLLLGIVLGVPVLLLGSVKAIT